METYLTSRAKNACYGCRACEQVCNLGCIDMEFDNEGFIYPEIDNIRCTNCNLCKKVCPVEFNINMTDYKQKVYAAWSNNEDILRKSSSGGIFSEIAINILNDGGYVVGAVLYEDMIVRHKIINNKNDLNKLRGSKYVQSSTENTFREIRKLLKNGEKVLFSGVPCQVSGLKMYLDIYKVDKSKLFTIDIICHGVPSPIIFKEYIKSIEYNNKVNISDFKFRDKRKHKWMLSYYCEDNKRPKKYIIPMLSPYYYGFMKNMLHRQSCYNCKFASTNREGDITLGDFWGVDKFHKGLSTENGISAIIINTNKGNQLFSNIKNDITAIDSKLEYVKVENKNLSNPSKKHEYRDKIYLEYRDTNFESISKKYLTTRSKILTTIKYYIPTRIKEKLKR